MLNNMKKKAPKLIATEILNKGNFIKPENRERQFYNLIIEIIDTKLYKPKQTKRKKTPKQIGAIRFDNKALEAIRFQ